MAVSAMPMLGRAIVAFAMVSLSLNHVFAQPQPAARAASELTASEASDVLSAATSADADDARKLLKSITFADRSIMPGGEPAVSVAARYGTSEVLAVFLDAGCDIRAQGRMGWTPLLAAIAAARVENVRLLLERGADPKVTTADNVTPLDLAMAMGDPRIVNMLQAVLTEQAASPAKYAQLLLQAAASGDPDTVGLLLKGAKNVDVTDNLGWTPLLYAVAAQSTPTVTLLLAAKSNVNHMAQNGVTPLMVAALTGNRDIVDLLLAKGANKTLVNSLGQTAGTIALASAAGDIAVKLGASTTDVATSHRLLAAAVARKDAANVKVLLDKGAPAERPVNATGDTPAIVVAACAGDVEIVKLLLQRGAKVDETDSAGVTPLIASALCNRKDVAVALLVAKASPQIKTKDGLDALTAAAARGHTEVVSVLAPSAKPTLDAVFDALNRKDLKLLTALVRSNPDLATRRDPQGKSLLAHAIMVAEPAMIEAVAGMPGVDVNAPFETDTPLTFAISANRLQAARTLVKLGARPTALVYQNAERKTAFELAAERSAADLLQVMSQAARKELIEIQSNLFTLGFLASPPDGSWGPATQTAWEKAREERAGNRYAATMGDLVANLAQNRLRICNQTSAKRTFAVYVESLSGTFEKLHGWYSIESGKCDWVSGVNASSKFYVTAGYYKLQDASNGGARFTYCTKDDRMGNEVSARDVMPPCSGAFKPTLFTLVTNQAVPFMAR